MKKSWKNGDKVIIFDNDQTPAVTNSLDNLDPRSYWAFSVKDGLFLNGWFKPAELSALALIMEDYPAELEEKSNKLWNAPVSTF